MSESYTERRSCTECGHRFEVVVATSPDQITATTPCVQCGGVTVFAGRIQELEGTLRGSGEVRQGA